MVPARRSIGIAEDVARPPSLVREVMPAVLALTMMNWTVIGHFADDGAVWVASPS